VVFITARTQAAEVREFHALGARSVLAKPFDPMTLADRVRECLG
jgi:DNA-binding response OmpR family regulator